MPSQDLGDLVVELVPGLLLRLDLVDRGDVVVELVARHVQLDVERRERRDRSLVRRRGCNRLRRDRRGSEQGQQSERRKEESAPSHFPTSSVRPARRHVSPGVEKQMWDGGNLGYRDSRRNIGVLPGDCRETPLCSGLRPGPAPGYLPAWS